MDMHLRYLLHRLVRRTRVLMAVPRCTTSIAMGTSLQNMDSHMILSAIKTGRYRTENLKMSRSMPSCLQRDRPRPHLSERMFRAAGQAPSPNPSSRSSQTDATESYRQQSRRLRHKRNRPKHAAMGKARRTPRIMARTHCREQRAKWGPRSRTQSALHILQLTSRTHWTKLLLLQCCG